MTCEICGIHDIWAKASASNLFFLKCIDKLHNKQFQVALWKKISNEFEKVNLGRPDITYQKWIKTGKNLFK